LAKRKDGTFERVDVYMVGVGGGSCPLFKSFLIAGFFWIYGALYLHHAPIFKTQFMTTVYPDQPITDFNTWIKFIHHLINNHGKGI
jgi:hypothetical protein